MHRRITGKFTGVNDIQKLNTSLSNLQTACQGINTDDCLEIAKNVCSSKDDKDECLKNFAVTEGGKRRKKQRRTKKKSRKAKKAKKAKKKTKRSRK